jgi:hypothetical protein
MTSSFNLGFGIWVLEMCFKKRNSSKQMNFFLFYLFVQIGCFNIVSSGDEIPSHHNPHHHSSRFKVAEPDFHPNFHPLYRANNETTNYNPFSTFTNSDFVKSTYLAHYSSEWKKYPIAITVVADHNFLSSIIYFVDSMLSFGFELKDILIICMNSECVELTKERIGSNVQSYHYKNEECLYMKCTVGK